MHDAGHWRRQSLVEQVRGIATGFAAVIGAALALSAAALLLALALLAVVPVVAP